MGSSVEARSTSLADTPLLLGVVLFLLSTATVLFTLTVFRLLAFFVMPSLFFDLLFIGFPIGALIGVKFFQPTQPALRRSLCILLAMIVLSICAAFLCKHFDYLRAHLFEIQLGKLILQICAFTGLFIPFFSAYGLSEYLGYQVGRERLPGRMRSVYGIYLFGAAFAFVVAESLSSYLGISRLLIIVLCLVTISLFMLSPRGWQRWLSLGATAVLLVALVPSQIENQFLRAYKFQGPGSTNGFAHQGYESVFQRWGSYFHVEVMRHPSQGDYAGFYNDIFQWFYAKEYGYAERSIGMLPINWAPQEGTIAIIGAGGGRQVRWALSPQFHFQRIVAIEVEPTVVRAVRGPLQDDFGGVYEDERVEIVTGEARNYMESTSEQFDLIFLPSVGGYPQMMLEPGNMIRTADAYRTLRDRLTDRGILAIWYPQALDPKGILTKQYVQTFESKQLGMRVRAFATQSDVLIMASADSAAPLPTVSDLQALLEGPMPNIALPPVQGLRPNALFIPPDIHFRPITDNQPFLAGNVRHILALDQVYLLFGLAAALVIVVAGIVLYWLRRTESSQSPRQSYLQFAGISFLIGANFLLFEHFTILALFRKLYMYHDAVVIGAISYLVLTGLGSILITSRWRWMWQVLAAACVVALFFLLPVLSPTATLALVAPVAFVTGSFFPAVFEAADRNPLIVFAMDAIGAALGSIVAFFVPIAFGFRFFFPLAAGVFLVTIVSTYLFFQAQETSHISWTRIVWRLRVPWPAVVSCLAVGFLGWIALGPRESASGTGLDYALFIIVLVLSVVVVGCGIYFSVPTRQRRRCGDVLVCIVGFVFLSVTAWEYLAQRNHHPNPWHISNDVGVTASKDLPFERAPFIEWVGRSNGDIAVKTGEDDPYAEWVTFRTDADGFRNADAAAAADIIFLGDGMTEAGNVAEADTFPRRVERRMGLSVRNLGRAGYSPPSQIVALERFGLKNEPRLVVWQISESDDLMESLGFRIWKTSGLSPVLEARRHATLSATFKERSPTYRLFQSVRWKPPWPLEGTFEDADNNHYNVRFAATPNRAQSPIAHPGARVFAEALQQGSASLRRRGIDLLVVFVPMKIRALGPHVEFNEVSWQTLPENWDLPESQKLGHKLEEICQDLGINFIDTTPALRNAAKSGILVYPPLDSHLSPAGHEVLADIVVQELAEYHRKTE